MKNSKLHLMKKVCLSGVTLCLVLFASCKNFMKSAEVQDEIQAAISYANAEVYTITVDYEGSNGVVKYPAGGTTIKKVTDTFALRFDTFADYEFLYWKIIDKQNNKELNEGEYLALESMTESETTCTLLKAPEAGMKLCVVPVLAARPKILSYSPILTEEMTLKDTPIQVMFDHDMDEESIYYTDKELEQIMAELNITDKEDSNLLHVTMRGEEHYNGYIKDGQKYFKSMSITNNLTGENLNNCFVGPVFETKRIVAMYADMSNLPENYEQILITMDKNFFYKEEIKGSNEKKPVTLSESKKWIYQVDKKQDTTNPEFLSCEFKIASGVFEGQSFYLPKTLNFADINAMEKNVLSSGNKIHLTLKVKDRGCGVDPEFKLVSIYNADSDYNYTPIVIKEFTLPFDYVSMQEASFDNTIDLSELYGEELADGVYGMFLEIKDRGGRIRQSLSTPGMPSHFFFIKDTTPPKEDIRFFSHFVDEDTATISLITPIDVEYVEIWNNTTPETVYKMFVRKFWCSGDVNIVQNAISHNFSIRLVDIAGNKSNVIQKTISAKNAKAGFSYVEGITSNEEMDGSDLFISGRTITIPDLCVCDHEVTQGEFEQYMTYDPNTYEYSGVSYVYKPVDEYGKGDNYPVYYVNWFDAIVYCNLRSAAEGLTPAYYLPINGEKVRDVDDWMDPAEGNIKKNSNGKYYIEEENSFSALDDIKFDETADGYRLPTEVEWEYVAREANASKYGYTEDDYGNTLNLYSGSNDYEEVGWAYTNSDSRTHEVKGKIPNILGLYDMTGNVWEWCYDWYTENITTTTPWIGPTKSATTVRRSHRGGSWCQNNVYNDVTKRQDQMTSKYPEAKSKEVGFRVVRNISD